MNRLRNLVRTDAAAERFLPTEIKAQPFRIDPPHAREAILLLHGLTGNPNELRGLADALAGVGYAVSAPRHPGHGTSRADLLKADASDWVRSSFDAYLDLKADYDTVHVLGHSMGGLLATATAIAFGAPKLILLAPAFLVSTNNVPATLIESHFRGFRVRKGPQPEFPNDDDYLRRMRSEYWSVDLVVPVANLMRLALTVKKELSRLRSRTLVVVGDNDPVVPPSVVPLIKRRAVNAASIDSVVLKGAGHIFTFDERTEETARAVLAWIGEGPRAQSL